MAYIKSVYWKYAKNREFYIVVDGKIFQSGFSTRRIAERFAVQAGFRIGKRGAKPCMQ